MGKNNIINLIYILKKTYIFNYISTLVWKAAFNALVSPLRPGPDNTC